MASSVVVMYPSPGIGHLISMVELGKLITTHHPSFSITILTTTPSFDTGSTASYIRRVSATTPSITFHHLPPIPINPTTYHSFLAAIFDLLRLNIPNLRQALQSISLSAPPPVTAFVVDMFCTPAADVAAEFGIPTYGFYPSGAAALAWSLYFPTVHRNTTRSFKDMNDYIQFPGLPPLHSSDMAVLMQDRNFTEYKSMLEYFSLIPKLSGLITNTFRALELKYVEAIETGLCLPDGPTPPIFCIGPLIGAADSGGGGDCLRWLDSQPSRSVVFLCFGSMGLFTAEQLKEMAIGLEKSGQRFLWVVRSPPPADKSKKPPAAAEPDLDSLLPEGFLERTKERGLVVKSWAPQVEVLNHDSVGGFVTHCGWNSVMEAVSAGVPMVARPLYAEQKMIRAFIVGEFKLALPLSESEGGFVPAAELEKRVRQLMESEDGKAIKGRIKTASEGAKAAMSTGGSSLTALAKLVELWKGK